MNIETNTSPSFIEQDRVAALVMQRILRALSHGLNCEREASKADPDNLISLKERLLIEDGCRRILAAREIF
jgi:hypothetical protein